jgi:hypothetical protein
MADSWFNMHQLAMSNQAAVLAPAFDIPKEQASEERVQNRQALLRLDPMPIA